MSHPVAAELMARAQLIRLVVFDVDGVLTDGRLYLLPNGDELKSFHARDGMGIRLLREHGLETAVISGRRSTVVAQRMAALHVQHVYQGQDDKSSVLLDLLKTLDLQTSQVAYVGDDIIDVPVMRQVGLAVAVADAHASACAAAHWVTRLPGGFGAAREVCDVILSAQGHHDLPW
jgi:3-deoxy-D-manno-octulosonate 8-phosphate phosphatase (KDO 8-P phosphatase)